MSLSIDALKQQHQRLLEIVGAIAAMEPAKQAGAIASQLTLMKQTIMAHLEAEDRELYPALRRAGQSADAPLSLTTNITMFFDEMEQIKPVVLGFLGKWTEPAIAADPPGFTAELSALATALRGRITREETRLYPLYQQHCAKVGA